MSQDGASRDERPGCHSGTATAICEALGQSRRRELVDGLGPQQRRHRRRGQDRVVAREFLKKSLTPPGKGQQGLPGGRVKRLSARNQDREPLLMLLDRPGRNGLPEGLRD